ncbi:uracil phosphoribosyltransferase [Thiomicrorhabdus xiamenensis]|uniref:Uracil phosphoribosyltransferase n=1 Tax=Thiomicrorhabdus xiamenensis TaxID=2739063 RepID=A0A7D4P4P5_9GAMM|nr:uracil phosphoribosyltransferase [Thiomicrorhabdus xiamenensis]QKI89396.1 uracil phosphoribosyltransferase [Thiomicrorhabdus xiamenensis]
MLVELTHPLAKDLVNRLRSTRTEASAFKEIIEELSRILIYRALEEIDLQPKQTQTWRGESEYPRINQQDIVLIPIMRAGLPMLDGLYSLLPHAPNGFMAMRRDEVTHEAKFYYDRIPDCSDKTVILLDPMVATGGSLNDAVAVIRERSPRRIISLNIIGAPEGIQRVRERHPELDIYIAQIDECLDENKFIFPGLGDAGDRAFNTPE